MLEPLANDLIQPIITKLAISLLPKSSAEYTIVVVISTPSAIAILSASKRLAIESL